VNSKTDADTQVSQAIRHLTGEGVLKTDVTKRRGSEPLEMSVEVKDIK
jgi:hypothetical protein